MAYTVSQLVTRAYYLSNVVAQGFETVSGDQLNEGVDLLNELLAIKTANQRLIPYYTSYDFNGVIGQETYFVPNLILVETLVFYIATVRYPMNCVQRHEFFGTPRADAVNSLPFQYFVERTVDGANISVYYHPQDTYLFRLHGKFALGDVTLNQDLSLTLSKFYISYLRYALAGYIAAENGIILQPQTEKELMKMESVIFDVAPLDFSTRTKSMLGSMNGPDIYGQVNIGKGWTRTG